VGASTSPLDMFTRSGVGFSPQKRLGVPHFDEVRLRILRRSPTPPLSDRHAWPDQPAAQASRPTPAASWPGPLPAGRRRSWRRLRGAVAAPDGGDVVDDPVAVAGLTDEEGGGDPQHVLPPVPGGRQLGPGGGVAQPVRLGREVAVSVSETVGPDCRGRPDRRHDGLRGRRGSAADPHRVPGLRTREVVVELHEFRVPHVTSLIGDPFAETHLVTIIEAEPHRAIPDLIADLPSKLQQMAVDEHRPRNSPMSWAHLVPRSAFPGPTRP
jgi:hypothetical protein